MSQVVVRAQFRLPKLPTPPRIIFGGFRPFFTRPRPRPRPRPPFLIPANQFLQQQNLISPLPSFRPQFQPQPTDTPAPRPPRPPPPRRPPPPPQSNNFFPPPSRPQPPATVQFTPSRPDGSQSNFQQTNAPSFRPPPQPQPNFQQTNAPSRRPSSPPTTPRSVDLNGFGAPRPESIIQTSQIFSQPQIQPPPPRPSSPPSFSSPQSFPPSSQSSFPQPLLGPNSNNIIGMTPPPPPRPTPPPPPPPPRPSTLGPLVPITLRPDQAITAPSSNSLESLLINPVPSVNAGILPLANEKPLEAQRFPPFT